jgi:hypothetical protein
VRVVTWFSPQTSATGTLASAASNTEAASSQGLGAQDLALGSLPPSGTLVAGSVSPPEPSIEHTAFRASLERGGEESAVLPGVPYVVAAGESVQVRLGTEVQTVSGPSVLEFQLDPERASGWRLVITAGSGTEAQLGVVKPKPTETTLNSSPPAVQEAQTAASWSEVAEALRAGEQPRAEAALQRLAQGTDAKTRDSARLALAQLWLSQGRRDEARGVLRALSEAGSTAFIRRRAAELLGG